MADKSLATPKQYQRWIQLLLFRLSLPMTTTALSELSIGELRKIATLMKAYDHESARNFSRNELIQFIGGHQADPSQIRPLEAIRGVNLPDWSEQRYRQILQSIKDPWQRP